MQFKASVGVNEKRSHKNLRHKVQPFLGRNRHVGDNAMASVSRVYLTGVSGLITFGATSCMQGGVAESV